MPVRRGHVAPKTTLIETIIRKFDTHDRSFVVANNQPNSCHIIFCSDGFCKMTGFTRAEIMQRSAVTEFLHGDLTSKTVCSDIQDALKDGQEKHFEILYYRKDGQKFICSEVIAPIRSEVDDISLFIINFEDLTDPHMAEASSTTEDIEPLKLTKFGKARASFRQSFRFGNMALRDRGHRLAGYLTPPSDATEEQEDEAASERIFVHCDTNSDKVSQTTVLRIESHWDNNSAPALIKTKDLDQKHEPITRTEETKNTTSTNKVYPQADLTAIKPEFQQTKSLDFETKGPSGKAVRQYLPYVSSESDLQRYRAITLQKHPSYHPSRASSSLSNVPSDSTKPKSENKTLNEPLERLDQMHSNF